jgi:hypothetical protein
MGLITSTGIGARLATLTASLRARNQPICRCRRRPNMGWQSTSKPRKRSASKSRQRCSPGANEVIEWVRQASWCDPAGGTPAQVKGQLRRQW